MTWYGFEIKNEEMQERRWPMRTDFKKIYDDNRDKFNGTTLLALQPEHTNLYFISMTPPFGLLLHQERQARKSRQEKEMEQMENKWCQALKIDITPFLLLSSPHGKTS